jgi:hypothetical protein
MRTTVTLDETRLERATELTGINSRTDLLNAALDALIAHESAMRLARLGGSQPDLELPPRRRSV